VLTRADVTILLSAGLQRPEREIAIMLDALVEGGALPVADDEPLETVQLAAVIFAMLGTGQPEVAAEEAQYLGGFRYIGAGRHYVTPDWGHTDWRVADELGETARTSLCRSLDALRAADIGRDEMIYGIRRVSDVTNMLEFTVIGRDTDGERCVKGFCFAPVGEIPASDASALRLRSEVALSNEFIAELVRHLGPFADGVSDGHGFPAQAAAHTLPARVN
jgi:hypothetical protein